MSSKWIMVDLRNNKQEITYDNNFEDSAWLEAFRKGEFAYMWKLLVETDNMFVFQYLSQPSGLYIMVRE